MFSQMGQLLVEVAASLLVFLLLARFHFQWLRVPLRNPLGEFVVATTDWLVQPARRLVPGLSGLDLATLAAAWLVQALALWALHSLRGWEAGDSSGAAAALLAALAFVDLVRYSLYLLVFAVIVQAVLSWVNPYSPVAPFFEALTRPFLRPLRRLVPLVANVDLSPLVLLVLLQLLLIPLAHLRAALGGAAF